MGYQAQTFHQHLSELRRRMLFVALSFLVGSGAGYYFHVPLIGLLRAPLHQTIYYTSPVGAFNLAMKVSVVVGLLFLLPTLAYQLARFVEPVFNTRIKPTVVYKIGALSLLLGVAGAVFAYWLILPLSLHFFGSFKLSGVQTLISANEYLNYITSIIISFVIIFQLPLLILFIDRIRPIPPKKFLKYERHVMIGSLVIALVLPFTYDPLSQLLIALPIVVLYNLSILFIILSHHPPAAIEQSVVETTTTSEPQVPLLQPSLEIETSSSELS